VEDYVANTTRLPSDRFVFVEVAVAKEDWLAEAQWVQSIADGGDKRVGAIIAQTPPGFGVPGADVAALGAALDALAALPLARGVRISSVDFTNASLVPVVSQHVGLLAARGLISVDVILPLGALALAVDNLAAVAAAQPSVTFILDHIGSPPYLLANVSLLPGWRAAMAQLGKVDNFVCKVGGVLQGYKSTGFVPGVDVVRPFVEHALVSFGYEKSLYEGNWLQVNRPPPTYSPTFETTDAHCRLSFPPHPQLCELAVAAAPGSIQPLRRLYQRHSRRARRLRRRPRRLLLANWVQGLQGRSSVVSCTIRNPRPT